MSPFSQSDLPGGATHRTESSATLCSALGRGSLGFAGVSLAGFSIWAFAGRMLTAYIGELGLYLACAIVFIALSGLALFPLVRGPGSVVRFYKIFLPAFALYAIGWSAAWFALGFGLGEWLGSMAGSFCLAFMIAFGLRNFHSVLKVCVLMFALHSAGYFLGEKVMQWLASSAGDSMRGGHTSVLAKLLFGLLYGLGVGAGLGYAFFTFQDQSARTAKINKAKDATPSG